MAHHQSLSFIAVGNWTPGQILGHVAAWIEYGWTGYPLKSPPWPISWLLRRTLKRTLRDGLKSGVKIPGLAGGTTGTKVLKTDVALQRLRAALQRLQAAEPVQYESPAFGPMSQEDRVALQLRHERLKGTEGVSGKRKVRFQFGGRLHSSEFIEGTLSSIFRNGAGASLEINVMPALLSSTFNAAGNRTKLAATIDSNADFVTELSYDNLQRMTGSQQHGVSGGNAVADKRIDLAYNAAGQSSAISRYAHSAGTQAVATSDFVYDGTAVN